MGWTNQQAETITGLAFTYLASTVLYSTGSSLSLDSAAQFTSAADIELTDARLVSTFTSAPGALAALRMLLDGVVAAGNRLLTAAVVGQPFADFTVDYDGQMEWGPGSSARDVTLARSSTGELELNGNALATSCDGFNATSAGDTTSSGAYTNTADVLVAGWVKQYDNTRVRVDFHSTVWSTVASTSAQFAVRFGAGSDVDAGLIHLNSTDHHQCSGTVYVSGLAAGTYNVRTRWRRAAGTGTLTQDFNDWNSLSVQEVA